MRGIALYTGLRVALLVAAWLLVQAITPLRGLIAIAVALVVSGIISFVVLDRPRDRASAGLAGVFRRIDDRIERSKTAEDVDDEPRSGQRQPDAQQEPVAQDEQPRALQDGDEGPADRPAGDGGDRPDREESGQGA